MAGGGADRDQKPSIETKRGDPVANAFLRAGCGGANIFSKLLKCGSLFIAQSGQIAVECLLFRERFAVALHNFFEMISSSTSRIQALCAQSLTLLPLSLLRFGLTPRE